MSTHLRITGRTDTGNVRKNNEDAFLIADLNGGGTSANGDWGGKLNATVLLAGVGGELPEATAGESVQETYRILQTFDQ